MSRCKHCCKGSQFPSPSLSHPHPAQFPSLFQMGIFLWGVISPLPLWVAWGMHMTQAWPDRAFVAPWVRDGHGNAHWGHLKAGACLQASGSLQAECWIMKWLKPVDFGLGQLYPRVLNRHLPTLRACHRVPNGGDGHHNADRK